MGNRNRVVFKPVDTLSSEVFNSRGNKKPLYFNKFILVIDRVRSFHAKNKQIFADFLNDV